jgi:hypothetical protein
MVKSSTGAQGHGAKRFYVRKLKRRTAQACILTLLISGGASGCEKYLLSKDNRFLAEACGNQAEIVERIRVIPLVRSSSATRALPASLGHKE